MYDDSEKRTYATPDMPTLEYLRVLLNGMEETFKISCENFSGDGEIFKQTGSIWLSLMGYIVDNHPDSENVQLTSLMFHRLYDTASSLSWSMVSVFSAGFESALRDLRFHFEDAIQTYYLDTKASKKTRVEKIQHISNLEERRIWSSTLIKKCGFPEADEKEILDIYWNLNKFAHSTDKIMRGLDDESEYRWGFDPERFKHCIELHRQVYDLITWIIIYSFSLRIDDEPIWEFIVNLLELLGFDKSLSLLKS